MRHSDNELCLVLLQPSNLVFVIHYINDEAVSCSKSLNLNESTWPLYEHFLSQENIALLPLGSQDIVHLRGHTFKRSPGRVRRGVLHHKAAIIALKGRHCHYCKKYLAIDAITLDHVIPVSKGGHPWDVANVVISCEPCNSSKADLMPWEFPSYTPQAFAFA